MDKRYCPMCGKRIEPLRFTGTLQSSTGLISAHIFLTNHTEPICPGHATAISLNASNMSECGSWEIETPGYGESGDVPQAFYDAFCGEDEE